MTTVHFKLTDFQMRKLADAYKMKKPVTLRLNKSMIVSSGIPLMLTANEHKKVMSGHTHDITISASRVKSGGFLPALMAALPIIGTVLGAAGGASSLIKNVVDTARGKGNTRGKGPISDLNIPIVSNLAKIIGLGCEQKSRSRKHRAQGISLHPK